MSTSTLPQPARPTFGVEIELLIAVRSESDNSEDPYANVEGLPPILRAPDNDFNYDRGESYTLDRVEAFLDRYFQDSPFGAPLTSVASRRKALINLNPSAGLSRYEKWQAVVDVSVEAVSDRSCSWCGFLVSAITNEFRCRINDTCGLHVHVGTLADRLSLDQVRRFAAISYAAEPLLFTLFDPVRRLNKYSMALRDHSLIANRVELTEDLMYHSPPPEMSDSWLCHRYPGRDRRHGEPPMSSRDSDEAQNEISAFLKTREPGHFEPFIPTGEPEHTEESPDDLPHEPDPGVNRKLLPLTDPAERPRKRNIPRFRLPNYYEPGGFQALAYALGELATYWDDLETRGPGPGVFEATQRIFSRPSSCYIARELMCPYCPSISFRHYDCVNLSGPSSCSVEFRLAEASLDGQWIATWAKICCGLLKFALNASPSDFIGLLTNCDRADREDGSYDVVDLLDDLGLFAEAEIVEKRLVANMDWWRLEFAEPKS